MSIVVERAIDKARQQQLGIERWPVWEKEASRFDWEYGASETCYLIEGEVTVTPESGEAVTLSAGDLAVFPAGMRCVWEIHRDLVKHYRFG
ncbi:cupin domain-containing protein [Chitinibacteraceae bacterium HSL-7]